MAVVAIVEFGGGPKYCEVRNPAVVCDVVAAEAADNIIWLLGVTRAAVAAPIEAAVVTAEGGTVCSTDAAAKAAARAAVALLLILLLLPAAALAAAEFLYLTRGDCILVRKMDERVDADEEDTAVEDKVEEEVRGDDERSKVEDELTVVDRTDDKDGEKGENDIVARRVLMLSLLLM